MMSDVKGIARSFSEWTKHVGGAAAEVPGYVASKSWQSHCAMLSAMISDCPSL